MLGAIIGDIVGSRFEFNPTNDYNFKLFGDGCSFTDDTICTIAIADAILRGRDYGESLHEWCRRYPKPKGEYGGRFAAWVRSDNPKPYGSFGNGSAMRVSAVAWWYNLDTGMIEQARKSAACTHNHPLGIDGAVAVAAAIRDCHELRLERKGKTITRDDILTWGLHHAIYQYRQDTHNFSLDIESYRNRFDETCQGTVPVALAIVLESTGFEDAIRRAVSLGADADTLGAIVGSIAEALWGIPEWMKEKAMSYLPFEMLQVVSRFNDRLNRRRKLSAKCKYFSADIEKYVESVHSEAWHVEHEWVESLAESWLNAKKIKDYMRNIMPLYQWRDLADAYALPITLVGKILQTVDDKRHDSRAAIKRVEKFLAAHYQCVDGERRQAIEAKKQARAVMLWRLGLGNMGRYFAGLDFMPSKQDVATPDMIKVTPIPARQLSVSIDWPYGYIPHEVVDILRRGHIPVSQDDHWIMYFNDHDNTIHYLRSLTGHEMIVAHISGCSRGYVIKKVEINKGLSEFGVNGDMAALALLRYLIVTEAGGDNRAMWDDYLDVWEELNAKR